jgi:hypothetical protein
MMNSQFYTPDGFTRGPIHGTHCIEGWIGSRGGLDAVENKKVPAFAGSRTTIFLYSEIIRQYHCTSIMILTKPDQYQSNIVAAMSVPVYRRRYTD